MHFIRGLFFLVICVELSWLQFSSVSGSSSSLWGKKLEFEPKSSSCLWQLAPGTVIPALDELSVCMQLKCDRHTVWTAFVYKAPASNDIEFGLQGKSDQLTLWLFGNETKVTRSLEEKQWHSVCVTWSGMHQKLQLFINGTNALSKFVKTTTRTHLHSNGTLTLGKLHNVKGNSLQPEPGKSLIGDISQFRIWSKQWNEGDLKRRECIEADVISWDHRHWKTNCPDPKDCSLLCEWSKYKVIMKIIVQYKHIGGDICSLASLKNVTHLWLENIFPSNISVNGINISPSHACSSVFAVLHGLSVQDLTSVCHSCVLFEAFVEVDPAADVGMVQSDITARLRSPFNLDQLNMTADPDSVLVFSVDSLQSVTQKPPTVNTVVSPGPTKSMPPYPGNTTEEPQEINKTIFKADTFFRVNMTLGVIGALANPLTSIKTLVDEKLNFSSTMEVLNFRIENIPSNALHSGPSVALAQQLYHCMFHVQEDFIYNVSKVQSFIENVLNISFSNESISVHTVNQSIGLIVPSDCPEDVTNSILYGTFFWPPTFPQEPQEMLCQDPPDKKATRLCALNIRTDTTKWERPDMTNCNPKVTLPELENVTVTTENAAEVVEALQDLVNSQLNSSSELSMDDLGTVLGKLSEVVDVGTDFELGANIVSIVGNILVSNTNVTTVSNTMLNLTSKMGDTMDFQGKTESITAPALALSLCNVETEGFIGLTFGVSSVSANLEPEVFVDQQFDSDQIQNTKASISLPSEVQDFFSPENNSTRLQFQFYATDELFQDPNVAGSSSKRTLNSYIVSASLNNSEVHDLSKKVVVTLSHRKATQCRDKVECVFWDFHKNGGHGGWNKRGCETQNISQYQTRCLCDHLTHFALLLDVTGDPISELDTMILTVISYIGCGVSAIFLGITLLTYLAFGKLRRDNPSKILINLSAALLGLCMLFLLNSWLSSFSSYSLCIATAATLHYFLLASFTWMGLEALHMYLALVKVFNIYVPSYILKFCAVGWGLPLVIVSLVLAIDKDSYGGSTSQEAAMVLQSTDFCWVTSDVVLYVTVLGFILLVLLANLSVFVVVLIQIKRMQMNKPSANSGSRGVGRDLRAVASLTVLLGLTWAAGFFSFGPGRVVMMYVFSILNTLQGFFVFLFHCLMKDNVRKQWRIHLCCGRFRLSDYSDWSRTATGGKKTKLVNMDSETSATTTTTRKISDSLN